MIGDSIAASGEGPTRRFTISGLAKLGGVSSLGGATIAIFDVATAQELLRKRGQLDAISVAAKRGVSEERLAREIAPIVPDFTGANWGRASQVRREGHQPRDQDLPLHLAGLRRQSPSSSARRT
jgi:hypothetical protein